MSEAAGKTLLSEVKDMISDKPLKREGYYQPAGQYRQYRAVVADISGIYEDESDWLYCSIFLRLWFFKCVV
jgi:hypothetical protein